MNVSHLIYLVEDDLDIQELIVFHLKKEGYQAEIFSDGHELIEKIKQIPPDFLVLDIMLPGLDGFEICRRVRQNFGDFPILFLSARQTEADKILGFELGADDYLTKPFSMKELMARIRVRLQKKPKAVSEFIKKTVQYGDFEWDQYQLKILLLGNNIELTGNEYRLLAFFLANPGRVFTRDQLLERVWQNEFDGFDRAVDGAIKRLRKKLEPFSRKEYILTLRGFGYQFKSE